MAQQKTRARRSPKKITPQYLENAALHYLQKFSSSSENLRRVLMRKVKRSCDFHSEDSSAAAAWVEVLIQRYIVSGLINDMEYSRARTATLRRQGRSRRDIQARLQAKGISAEMVKASLKSVDQDVSGEDAELAAALAFIRRKKLGPFRVIKSEVSPEYERALGQRELAALARAGFSCDVALRVLKIKLDSSLD